MQKPVEALNEGGTPGSDAVTAAVVGGPLATVVVALSVVTLVQTLHCKQMLQSSHYECGSSVR